MQHTLKRFALVLATTFLALAVFAQKDNKKYKADADAMRAEVWAWNKPEFNVRAIPAEYAKSSRVVIARHMDISNDAKRTMGYRQFTTVEIMREAVKLNDKLAVQDFSEISYAQLQTKSQFYVSTQTTSYVGVRVIKSDGSVKEVPADDIVLTKDERSEKQAKLAIPDLVPGDIIDYFIARTNKGVEAATTVNESIPFTFTFFDANPVLHYSVHCSFDPKYAAEYRLYNGAPDFRQSRNKEDGIVLDVAVKNIIPLGSNNIWISPLRQLPVTRLNLVQGVNNQRAVKMKVAGRVYKNQVAEGFVMEELDAIAYAKQMSRTYNPQPTSELSQVAQDYYKDLRKVRNGLTADSLAAELFYVYRFQNYLQFAANSSVEKVINMSHTQVNPSGFMFKMGEFMKYALLKNKMILITSKYGPELDEVMSRDDITYMLMVEGSKPRLFGMTDIFSPAFYVPAHYENTKQAIVLDTKNINEFRTANFDRSTIDIPASKAKDNLHLEQLSIKPDLAGAKLQVARNTVLTGHYKSDTQQELILFEDYYEAERKIFGEKESLIEALTSNKRTRKYGEELKIAFDEERRKQKDRFLSEAKNEFDQDISDLQDYKIVNMGVRHNKPDFVYSAKFNMGGLLKKAGNNYILEVGKLQGSPLKVDDDQRKRSLDVYAPFARTIQYEIALDIPEGYSAEGVEALNKKVENSTGSFIVEAVTKGNTVAINVRKTYNNAYEPSANWVGLLAFIDAANEWSNSKILLKKK